MAKLAQGYGELSRTDTISLNPAPPPPSCYAHARSTSLLWRIRNIDLCRACLRKEEEYRPDRVWSALPYADLAIDRRHMVWCILPPCTIACQHLQVCYGRLKWVGYSLTTGSSDYSLQTCMTLIRIILEGPSYAYSCRRYGLTSPVPECTFDASQ